jgi:hypothetical protein
MKLPSSMSFCQVSPGSSGGEAANLASLASGRALAAELSLVSSSRILRLSVSRMAMLMTTACTSRNPMP